MTAPLPPAAIGAAAPTSRSTFRLLAKCVGATNREADTLRHGLLTAWGDGAAAEELVDRLRSLDRSDPDGDRGVDARLAVWFSFSEFGDHQAVEADHPVLTGLSDELRTRLADIGRRPND